MKTIALIAAFVFATSPALSAELGNTGITVGGEFDAHVTPEANNNEFGLDFTPELGYSFNGLNLSVDTTIDMMELNNAGLNNGFPGLDFEADYDFTDNLDVYGKVSTDSDIEFGDVTVGTRFTF